MSWWVKSRPCLLSWRRCCTDKSDYRSRDIGISGEAILRRAFPCTPIAALNDSVISANEVRKQYEHLYLRTKKSMHLTSAGSCDTSLSAKASVAFFVPNNALVRRSKIHCSSNSVDEAYLLASKNRRNLMWCFTSTRGTERRNDCHVGTVISSSKGRTGGQLYASAVSVLRPVSVAQGFKDIVAHYGL